MTELLFTASLLLWASNAGAQSAEKEPAAILELGAAPQLSLTDGQWSFGPAVAVEGTNSVWNSGQYLSGPCGFPLPPTRNDVDQSDLARLFEQKVRLRLRDVLPRADAKCVPFGGSKRNLCRSTLSTTCDRVKSALIVTWRVRNAISCTRPEELR